MRHTSVPALPRERLNTARIGAYTGVIGVHAFALLLLSLPVQQPFVAPATERPPIVLIPQILPPPKPKPVEVEVEEKPKPRPKTTTAPTQKPVVATPVELPPATSTDARPSDFVVSPTRDGEDTVDPPVLPPVKPEPSTGESMRLQKVQAPPPPYPPQALRDQQQGTVLLAVTVDALGKPIEVAVRRSSGHRLLDRAARDQVLRTWRFRPAMRDGVAVPAIGVVEVNFTLQDA